jgi:hypothetical protein
VNRFTYDPGARMPWGHPDRVQEEAYVVVAGSGGAKLDDEVVELSVWGVLRIAPTVFVRSKPARRVWTWSASLVASPWEATPSGSRTSGF